jgi:HPt (histidine-containing phosphotransfer) domain-containing protein
MSARACCNRCAELSSKRSADEVRRAAHALKGSLSNFIDEGPTATAFELETMGREGRLDESSKALGRLEGEIATLIVRLREFREQDPKASISCPHSVRA